MLAAIEDLLELPNSASVPACLPPWRENPYRLVSLLDMLTFDAGELARAMQFLAEAYRIVDRPSYNDVLFADLPEGEWLLKNVLSVLEYCNKAGFPMTKVTLERIPNLGEKPGCPSSLIAEVLGEATRRLRDEAGIHKILKLLPDRVPFYEQTTPLFGGDVANAFPSATFDISESGKCFALGRNTACVFHLMRALELGLSALGAVFGVSLAHTNWAPALDQIESKIRDMHKDPIWKARPDCKEQQEFYAQAASHFGIFKDAWRNYTAHARGKYDEQEASDILTSVRAFMQKLSTRLHE